MVVEASQALAVEKCRKSCNVRRDSALSFGKEIYWLTVFSDFHPVFFAACGPVWSKTR